MSTKASNAFYLMGGEGVFESGCGPGSYGQCAAQEEGTAYSCAIGVCTPCPAGTFREAAGGLAEDDCVPCARGTFATEASGASSCETCSAGSYASDSAEATGYGVTVRAAHCVGCPAGKTAEEAGSTSCDLCPVGRSSEAAAVVCDECAAGRYADSPGMERCRSCQPGNYESERVTCILVRGGEGGAAGAGGVPRGGLPRGWRFACVARCCCSLRSPSRPPSRLPSPQCPEGYTSEEGSSKCDSCLAGRYGVYKPRGGSANDAGADDDAGDTRRHLLVSNSTPTPVPTVTASPTQDLVLTCKNCPVDRWWEGADSGAPIATCLGGDYLPIPHEGYFVDRSDISNAGYVYPCVEPDRCGLCKRGSSSTECKGREKSNGLFFNGLPEKNQDCWTRAEFGTDFCSPYESVASERSGEEGALQCQGGTFSLFCYQCVQTPDTARMIYSDSRDACVECGSGQELNLGLFVAVPLVALAIFLSAVPKAYEKCVEKLPALNYVDSSKLKVVWSTLQIVASIPWALDIEFPEPFNSLLDLYSVTQLNFLKMFALSCLDDSFSNYHPRAILTSIGPLVVGVLIWLVYFARKYLAAGGSKSGVSPAPAEGAAPPESEGTQAANKQSLFSEHMKWFLVVCYICLPAVAMTQFRGLRCEVSISPKSTSELETGVGVLQGL